MHRGAATVAALAVLASVAACGGEESDSADDQRGDTSGSTDAALTPAGAVAPALCGTSVAAQTGEYGPGPLVIQDLKSGETVKIDLRIPSGAETSERDGVLIESVCAHTSKGPMFVVSYGRTGAEFGSDEEQPTAGLFGVSLDGDVGWYTDVPTSEVPVVHGDAVLLADSDGAGLGDPAPVTVVDATDGDVIVDAEPLERATAISTDRIAYVDEDPVLADGELEPVWHGERDGFPTSGQWLTDGKTAVFNGDGAIVGLDARKGRQRWRLDTESGSMAGDVLDADAGVLITAAVVADRRLPAVEGPSDADFVLTGVDVGSGKVLWRRGYRSGSSIPVFGSAAGGAFTLSGDDLDQQPYDSRTGRPLTLPDGAKLEAVGRRGLLVADGDEYRVVDPSRV